MFRFVVYVVIIITILNCCIITIVNGVSKESGIFSNEISDRLASATPDELERLVVEKAKIKNVVNFQQVSRANLHIRHTIVFASKQKNMQRLLDTLLDVSNPLSDNYGQYLSKNEVNDFVSNPQSVHHIEQFLKQQGVDLVSKTKAGEFITAVATIQTWEYLLDTHFHVYQHIHDDKTNVIRCKEYALPKVLSSHVSFLFNTNQFPSATTTNLVHMKAHDNANPRKVQYDSVDSINVTQYITPSLINELYDIRNNTGSNLVSQAVFQTTSKAYSPADLANFQTYYKIPLEGVSDDNGLANDEACASVDGGANNCEEANLDVQYMIAIAQNIPTTLYYSNGSTSDDLLDWMQTVADLDDPPKVISVNYITNEADLDDDYITSFNTEAIKLGVQGVTLLAPSGDDGVAGHSAVKQPVNCAYRPQFPASSPYVTTVGGTMVYLLF
jgi:tripeptidyl-peptidase-1